MRVAIVGSRRRRDRETIAAYVAKLPPDTVIVSGGARGPDSWAADAARRCGLPAVEHLPDLAGVNSRWDATERYYARNQRIVEDCDLLVAFVAPDRKGGTEDTIRRAERAGKPIVIL